MLYYSFVYPHLLYGVEIYANCSNKVLHSLQVLNNKILRVLLKKPARCHINELYPFFNTLPLPLLFESQVLLLVHKCLYNVQIVPEILHCYFSRRSTVHNHNTRNNSDLNIPTSSTNTGQRRIMSIGANFWNNLPQDYKSCSSPHIFKNIIKSLLSCRMF